jgi:hypothetical protein
MLKNALIGLAIVVALVIVMVFAFGSLTPDATTVGQTLSITVGNRTVTVGGHYKDLTQESLADGMKITVDGHEITVGPDQLEVDGKTQVLEPGQDVAITVDEKGAVQVKVVSSGAGAPANAAQ